MIPGSAPQHRRTTQTLSRWQRLGLTCASVVSLIAVAVVGCGGSGRDNGNRASLDVPEQSSSASAPSSSPSSAPASPAATGRQVSVSANAPLPGMPPIASATNLYADAGANMMSAAVKGDPYLIYVPNSGGSSVDVINPNTMQIVGHYFTGTNPQHIVPSWDMKTLYATNDMGNSLTAFDPKTGKPIRTIAVADPYNMYFMPNGRFAIVVEEAQRVLAFRDPHTFALRRSLSVPCPGIDHMDFSANGGYLIASCEFSSQLVKINLHTLRVMGYLHLPGSSPQDVKLDPTGKVFYVADRYNDGVWRIDGQRFKALGFIKTGRDAHGLYPSRDGKDLYVTNRRAGSVTVINFATHRKVATWHIAGGGTPDMGGVSPDGKVLWLAGRYSSTIYALSTKDGHLIGRIAVGLSPHGLCVWPQPGRYSLGHTGVTR